MVNWGHRLEPNYVIFICCFDPFGKGLFRYTFTNCCEEIEMRLGDGTMKVFFSTRGRNDADVSPELVNFLKYVENSTDECVEELDDNLVRQIHGYVRGIKKSREWRRKYMRFEELLRKERREGCAEGREENEARMLALIAQMTEAGEADRLSKLTDQTFLQEMYRKYGL